MLTEGTSFGQSSSSTLSLTFLDSVSSSFYLSVEVDGLFFDLLIHEWGWDAVVEGDGGAVTAGGEVSGLC